MANYQLDPRSIEDAYVLTRVIENAVHEDTSIAERICPLTPVNTRQVQVAVREFTPVGLAAFKAQNASTPTRIGGVAVQRIFLDLPDIEEQEPISTQDILHLASADDRVALAAARNIVKIAEELRQRNRQRSIWMRWMAFRDQLSIAYETGDTLTIDFDLDNTDGGMDRSHVITLSGSDVWTNDTSDPIGQVQTWVDYIADDLGVDGAWLHMNRKTWRTLKEHAALKAFLTESSGDLKLLTTDRVRILFDLEGGIVVENGYYEDTDGSKVRFIPDGYVLVTAPYVVYGAPIAEMWDGPVVMYDPASNDLVVANNPGAREEIYVNPASKTKCVRVNTARMAYIRREAFIWAQVF